MKHKQNVIAVILSIIIMTVMGGCSSANRDVEDDIINYVNVEVPKIASIETEVNEEYTSVTGSNYKDDETTYDKVIKEVIPDSLKLINGAESITPKTEEVRAVHEIYISAVNAQHSAFSLLTSAIETQDSSKISSANEKLSEARKGMRDYSAKINELAAKYNVTINDKN